MNQKSHPPKSLKLVAPGPSQNEVPQSTYKPLNWVEPRLGIPSEFGSVPRRATLGSYSGALEGKARYGRRMSGGRRKSITALTWLCLGLTAVALAGYGFYAITDSSTTGLSREARLYEHQPLHAALPPAADTGLTKKPVNAAVAGDVNNLAKQALTKISGGTEESDSDSVAAIVDKLKTPASSISSSLSLQAGHPIPSDGMQQNKPETPGETVASVAERPDGAKENALNIQSARTLVSSSRQNNNVINPKSAKTARLPASSCTEAMMAMRLCEADEQ